jgi:hypothetical protein
LQSVLEIEFDKPDRKLQQANEQTNETADSQDRQQHMQTTTTTTTTPILCLCVCLSHTHTNNNNNAYPLPLFVSLSHTTTTKVYPLSLSAKCLGHTVLGAYLIFLTSGFRFSNWLVGKF